MRDLRPLDVSRLTWLKLQLAGGRVRGALPPPRRDRQVGRRGRREGGRVAGREGRLSLMGRQSLRSMRKRPKEWG